MDSELSKTLDEMECIFDRKIDFPCTEIEKLLTEYPKRLVVLIERKEDGYHSRIYRKRE